MRLYIASVMLSTVLLTIKWKIKLHALKNAQYNTHSHLRPDSSFRVSALNPKSYIICYAETYTTYKYFYRNTFLSSTTQQKTFFFDDDRNTYHLLESLKVLNTLPTDNIIGSYQAVQIYYQRLNCLVSICRTLPSCAVVYKYAQGPIWADGPLHNCIA